jgi:GTP-binding protein Era
MSDFSNQQQQNTSTKCGIVALIGAPNAGKSTLLNQCVGQKVSIISPKIQTTRQRIVGIALHENSQIIFYDTPGLFKPKQRLERAMVDAALSAANEADINVLLIDASNKKGDDTTVLNELIEKSKAPLVVVLNKVDLIAKEKLLEKAQVFNHPAVDRVFMISALHGHGVSDLLSYLAEKLPSSPWLYPEDDVTDLPQRLFAAEITREHLYHQLHQEIPYETYVETERFEEFNNGDLKIEQVIAVMREGQKKIVLGQKGVKVKNIRLAAQKEMSELFERKVHLFLYVKVVENWQDKHDFYRVTGLNFKA